MRSTRPTRCRARRCRCRSSSSAPASAARSRRGRTFYFVNAEQRLLDQSGLTTISPANAADRQRAAGGGRLSRRAGHDRPLSDSPIDSLNVLGKVDHAFSGRDQLSVRYSLYDVSSTNSRGAGGLSAPSASAGLDNRDQAIAFSNTLTLGARTVNETRAQFTHSDLLAPADRSGRPGRQHRRRGLVRHVPVEPAGPAEQDVPGHRQRRPAARRPRAARRRGPHLQRRPHHVPARRCAARTPSRRWRTSWPAPTTTPASRRPSATTAGAAGQRQPRPLRAGRVERDAAPDPQPRAALRPAVARDHRHRRQQPVAAGRVRVDAVRRRAISSSAAAPGSSSTACRCGRWPTRCCRPATPPTWRSLQQRT